jgi:hypothetical protein
MAEAKGWRRAAAALLWEAGVAAYDPTETADQVIGYRVPLSACYPVLSSLPPEQQDAIRAANTQALATYDGLLALVRPGGPTLCTAAEIDEARRRRIPIVVWDGDGPLRRAVDCLVAMMREREGGDG